MSLKIKNQVDKKPQQSKGKTLLIKPKFKQFHNWEKETKIEHKNKNQVHKKPQLSKDPINRTIIYTISQKQKNQSKIWKLRRTSIKIKTFKINIIKNQAHKKTTIRQRTN